MGEERREHYEEGGRMKIGRKRGNGAMWRGMDGKEQIGEENEMRKTMDGLEDGKVEERGGVKTREGGEEDEKTRGKMWRVVGRNKMERREES